MKDDQDMRVIKQECPFCGSDDITLEENWGNFMGLCGGCGTVFNFKNNEIKTIDDLYAFWKGELDYEVRLQ